MLYNALVVLYLNKQGGTVSKSLCQWTQMILLWLELQTIRLLARYIPGKECHYISIKLVQTDCADGMVRSSEGLPFVLWTATEVQDPIHQPLGLFYLGTLFA